MYLVNLDCCFSIFSACLAQQELLEAKQMTHWNNDIYCWRELISIRSFHVEDGIREYFELLQCRYFVSKLLTIFLYVFLLLFQSLLTPCSLYYDNSATNQPDYADQQPSYDVMHEFYLTVDQNKRGLYQVIVGRFRFIGFTLLLKINYL